MTGGSVAAEPPPSAPTIDIVDETFIVVAPARIAPVVADPARWRAWWPGLTLTVFMDRGLEGMRWSVTGALVGSSEVWLEAVGDGVVLHYFLRAEPTTPGSTTSARAIPASARGRRELDRLRRRHVIAWKQVAWSLKDELEGGRPPGVERGAAPGAAG